MKLRIIRLNKVEIAAIFLILFFLPLAVSNFGIQAFAQTVEEQNAEANRMFQQGIKQSENHQYKEGIQSLESALKIYRQFNNRKEEARTLVNLGILNIAIENIELGVEYLQSSLTIAREINDRDTASVAQQGLSIFEQFKDKSIDNKIIALLTRVFFGYATAEESRELAKIFDELCVNNFNHSQFKVTLLHCQSSLAIYQKIGDRLQEANALTSIATVYSKMGDNNQSLQLQQQALTIFNEINDLRGQIITLNGIANIYIIQSQYAQGLELLQQALYKLNQFDNPKLKAMILGNIGFVYQNLEQYSKALDYFQQSLTIVKRLNDLNFEAKLINNIAAVYLEQLQYQQAINYFNKTLVISRQENNLENEVQSLANIGEMYRRLGELSKSIGYFQQALKIAQKINTPFTQGQILNNIAVVYESQGRYFEAIQTHRESLKIAQKLNSLSSQSYIFNNLGVLYAELGQDDRALQSFNQSLQIAKKAGLTSQEIRSYINIGVYHGKQSDYSQALKWLAQGLLLAQKIDKLDLVCQSLIGISIIQERLAKHSQAINSAKQALEISEKINSLAQKGLALGILGYIYQVQGQYKTSLNYLEEALSIQRNSEYKSDRSKTLNLMGYSFLQLGRLEKAESSLFEAIQIRESLRTNLTDTIKISLGEQVSSAYVYLQLALVKQAKIQQALEISERGRTQAFIELLKQRFSPATEENYNSKYINIEEIKAIAKKHKSILVEYSIIYDNLYKETSIYIWVVKPTGEIILRQVDIKLWQQQQNITLASLVPRVRQSIGVRGNEIAFKPGERIRFKDDTASSEPWEIISVDAQNGTLRVRLPSFAPGVAIPRPITEVEDFGQTSLQQLHQILIEPIADLLPKNPSDRVIFIPQGELFLVPFAVLQDKEGKYLIEKHTILTAPSIQVLDLTRKQQQRVANSTAKDVLIVGNPSPMPAPFQPLEYAEPEAKAIANLLNTNPIIGTQATESAIVAQMSNAKIIHLATHGLFDDIRGLGSAIALAPSGKDDGLLTAEEILNLKLNAELVVLSACDTGRGRLTGDGVIGLSRSLISAGVPSVIVSLWKVPDNTTSGLMVEFYRQLQQNPDKAQALRQAMLTTMKQHPNPRDWAAFTLIGEAE
jgi:tetratricopeptide (TPR) repeat protein